MCMFSCADFSKVKDSLKYSCPLLCLCSDKESSVGRERVRPRCQMRFSERPISFIFMHIQLSGKLVLELMLRMWERVYQELSQIYQTELKACHWGTTNLFSLSNRGQLYKREAYNILLPTEPTSKVL